MISVDSAAKFICQKGDWHVTNLSLQKILYLAQMVYMGRHDGEKLFGGRFEAWDYGPVEPKIYHQVKMFGSGGIQDVFSLYGVPDVLDGDELTELDESCAFLLQKKPAELVAMTHWKDGAWAKNYIPGAKGIVIPDADILGEYRKRIKSADNG